MRPVTLLLLLAVSSSPVLAQDFATTRIAEGVYQFRFQSHNGFMVVTDDGVVVVDPISTLAASRFDHADHATGARVLMDAFGERVPVIAQDNASAKLVDAGPDLPAPDVTFTDRMTLHFGGRAIELYYLGKSHSDNMLVVLVPDVRVAFAVDFVSNDRVGYQDLPDYHFPDFYGALERLMTLEFDTIVFGHGPAGDPAAVRRQGQYYGSLRAAVQQAIDNGWTEDEAAERVRLPQYESWGQYEAWFPMNVRAIYRSLVTGR